MTVATGTLSTRIKDYPSAILSTINPLNAELNPIRHLVALVGARHILHVSRVRVKHVDWPRLQAGPPR